MQGLTGNSNIDMLGMTIKQMVRMSIHFADEMIAQLIESEE